uniref:39S ribosomal protein L30 n=1 Tax=Schistocephalus solidus TaxID=70667 RepID=A0A0X3PZY1_SCHSO
MLPNCLLKLPSELSVHLHIFFVRNICVTPSLLSKGRTYESHPVPDSEDALRPLGWAERLFDLKKLRKDFKPCEEPSPVLMVCRLKPWKGIHFYEKGFLEKYGMGPTTKMHKWVLVKNTPHVVKELDNIKHLVRVQPVEFPDGLPTTQEDLLNFRLLPNGKFIRKGNSPFRRGSFLDLSSDLALETCRKISSMEATLLTPMDANAKYLSRAYLRQWHNQRWEQHKLFSEFFTSHYKYRLNQDGQEYRYSRLWRLDDAMRQSIRQRLNPDGTYKARNNSRFEADWNTYPWSFY